MKRIIKNLLLGFVLVSIGFALGKELTLRSMRTTQASGSSPIIAPAVAGDKVIVYYLHGTIRCVTCNKIEKMAHEIVQRDFASDLKAGRIEWRTANFQNDEALAQRYNVFSSTVVLVKLSQGHEVQFKKLSDVWIHVDNPPAFDAYITGEIGQFLGGRRS
ncbi:MAG: nitrophenyl compound nitroreductase subunit ArsF family protein [Bacillota bacterium]